MKALCTCNSIVIVFRHEYAQLLIKANSRSSSGIELLSNCQSTVVNICLFVCFFIDNNIIPSQVIFSQSSDLMERQSSMTSSMEEVSGANNDLSGGSRRDDEQFGVFKDFDFLEYESESVEVRFYRF